MASFQMHPWENEEIPMLTQAHLLFGAAKERNR